MSDKSSLAVFDLNSQAGIRLVLAVIRQSELPVSEKNELKDLVLLYTSGGEDESVRISLEKKLSSHNLKPIEIKSQKPEQAKPTKPNLPFGSSRPLPNFSAPVMSVEAKVAEEKGAESTSGNNILDKAEKENVAPSGTSTTPKESSLKTPETEANINTDSRPNPPTNNTDFTQKVAQKNTKNIENTENNDDGFTKTNPPERAQTQKPLQGNAVNINRNHRPRTSASVGLNDDGLAKKEEINRASAGDLHEEKVIPPKISPLVGKSINSSQPATTTTPPVATEISPTATKHLNRIREIKSAVNKKVGNPVNLVDIDNQTGREYMNALLEAMKYLNTKGPELDRAMERLEKAYLAVEKAISQKNQVDSVMTESISKPEESQLEVGGYDKLKNIEANDDKPNKQEPGFLDKNNTSETLGSVHSYNQKSEQDNPSVATEVQQLNKEKISNHINDEMTKPVPLPQAQPSASTEAESVTQTSKRVTSLAEEARNLTPEDLPKTKNTSAEALGNPLYAPEVDDGLDQLLSDWPLFKKSGLFGTGPKGVEHPLFKKIANLQIPVLLAGRFEGASQEIRQSITDYMNGWRYEQGIIYQQGETFELYLRRVIRHILDAQKQRKPA